MEQVNNEKITINVIELCTTLAGERLFFDALSKGKTTNSLHNEGKFTDEAQVEFDMWYDYFFKKITAAII